MKIHTCLLLTILSCNSSSNEIKKKKQVIPENNEFFMEREKCLDSLAILDLIKKHENEIHYKTCFMETGSHLISCLYQGILNNQCFGIKTNCFDGTIVVYMKHKKKWQIIDYIDENIGWNFKTFNIDDINGDKYDDVTLMDWDNYRRIVFIYNKRKKIFEHKRLFDRLDHKNTSIIYHKSE